MQQTKSISLIVVALASTTLTACSSTLDKLDNINKPAPFSDVRNPTEQPEYKPMSWPLPENSPPNKQYANSLWQPGARAFFRDGRASRVGDLLKVNVRINDKLQFINQTEAKRTTIDNATSAETMGIAEKAAKLIPHLQMNPDQLVDITGNNNVKGTGTINRQDVITTQVTAIITQLLPNGNFVIDGTQEIMMNQDVREVSVRGVVRPQDIRSDNTIDSYQIAEARIAYTSRGQLSDQQKPRWGGQIIDAIAPF